MSQPETVLPFPKAPLRAIVEEGAALYRRDVVLPRLLPLATEDLSPDTPAVARRICALLARALRQERTRGRAGHWTYSLDRHIGLAQAYRAERSRLSATGRSAAGLARNEKGAAGGCALRKEI